MVGHSLQERRPLAARARQHLDLAVVDQALHRALRRHAERGVAGGETVRHRGAAAIGHVQQLDAGLEREPLDRELVDGAVARRAEGELAGLGLGLLDHVLDRGEAAARMREQQQRRDGDAGDGDQVLVRIVGRRRHQRGDGDEVAGGDEDRVAVRRRLGHGVDAERAAGAGAVLDHHGLAERLGELLADEARADIGDAAGRERHDDADGAAGPGLGRRGRGEQRARARGFRTEGRWQTAWRISLLLTGERMVLQSAGRRKRRTAPVARSRIITEARAVREVTIDARCATHARAAAANRPARARHLSLIEGDLRADTKMEDDHVQFHPFHRGACIGIGAGRRNTRTGGAAQLSPRPCRPRASRARRTGRSRRGRCEQRARQGEPGLHGHVGRFHTAWLAAPPSRRCIAPAWPATAKRNSRVARKARTP